MGIVKAIVNLFRGILALLLAFLLVYALGLVLQEQPFLRLLLMLTGFGLLLRPYWRGFSGRFSGRLLRHAVFVGAALGFAVVVYHWYVYLVVADADIADVATMYAVGVAAALIVTAIVGLLLPARQARARKPANLLLSPS